MKITLNMDVLKKAGLKNLRFLGAIAQLPYVEAIYLFGSRARGDYREYSDIDLAIKYSDKDEYHRMVVKAIVEEAKDTLLEVDLVDYNRELSPEFRQVIEEEKQVLYEAS